MIKRWILGSCVLFVCTGAVHAQGILEVPDINSFQSGIGIVSGWKCTAGTITIQFDNSGPMYTAAYGTIREDTLAVCGDTNNGWAFLWNWNRLGDGPHTVAVFDNGVQFDAATFTVQTLGAEFRDDITKEVTIPNFPAPGQTATLLWQQGQQNFVISNVTGSGPTGGVCTTKSQLLADFDRKATLQVTNPCQENKLLLHIVADSTNPTSFLVCDVSVVVVQGGVQFTPPDFAITVDATGADLCDEIAPGVTVNATLTVKAGASLNLLQSFAIYYSDIKILEFP